MDYNRTLEIILTSLLGGGGVAAIISAIRARRSKDNGQSAHEKVATSQIPVTTMHAPLGTPDWEALTRYWQNELIALRDEYSVHRADCARRQAEDGEQIDALEAHIWQHKPPPPPRRRQHKGDDN